ncbi:MAG: right-handed parallel beta-helix repeat-containing protein, partial [Bacteroidota bacterium]
APHPLWNIHAAPIIPFDKNKWESQPAGKDLLSTAQEKLNRFLHQESSCQEVFKTDKLAYFLALSDLCISYHGLYWHNLRFYYDPAVGKFEPIGFDSFGEAPPSSNSFLGLMAFQEDIPFINPILQILLYDEDFHKRYIAALQEIIQESFFQTFFEQYKEEILTKLHWLQKEYPFYSWEVTDWSERANYLKNLLYPHPKYSLQVYRRGSQLEFQNWHTLPLEVQLSNGQWKRVLPRESMFATTEERNEFNYRIPGLDYIFYTTITGENTKSYSVSATTLQIPSTLPLEINGKQLSLTSTDTFTISTPLVVPADYTLQLKGGLSLNLVKGGLLEIYGPCNWSNVKVYSEDQRGQGVYIEGSSSIEWEKVHIEDQRAPMVHQFQQFGAVTIVDSEVQFKHCTFRRNRGEDGLYLLRCEVSLEECSFAEQPSDGLDLDFCTGYLTSCSFFQNGNDGLDIAGGNLRLDRLILDGNQEKGLSIGEAARIQAENLRIVNSPIGMAVKDQSIVDLQNLYLKKVNMGIGVYQKKSIFGPAVCRINSLHLEMVPYLYRLGLGSTLILDGKTLEGR